MVGIERDQALVTRGCDLHGAVGGRAQIQPDGTGAAGLGANAEAAAFGGHLGGDLEHATVNQRITDASAGAGTLAVDRLTAFGPARGFAATDGIERRRTAAAAAAQQLDRGAGWAATCVVGARGAEHVVGGATVHHHIAVIVAALAVGVGGAIGLGSLEVVAP